MRRDGDIAAAAERAPDVLAAWIAGALDGSGTRFVNAFEDAADLAGPAVLVRFRGMARSTRPAPAGTLDATLGYAVRILDPDPVAGQRRFARLFLAAARADAPVTLAEAPEGETPGAPATLALEVRIAGALPRRDAPPVREPTHVVLGHAAPLEGRLVALGIPVAGAVIELPALDRRARSDADGRFSLPGGGATGPVTLRIEAAGRIHEMALPDRPGGRPVTIELPMEDADA